MSGGAGVNLSREMRREVRYGHHVTEQHDGENQYLVFGLGGEQYGVELLKIQEIREWEQPAPIPGTPDDIVGVLNLRGVVVPVIDLRIRFGLDVGFNRETVTIVTLIHGKTVGLVVDSVSDVMQLAEDEFKPAPEVEGVKAEHVRGIAAKEEGMVLLLDMDKVLSVDRLEVEVKDSGGGGNIKSEQGQVNE